MGCTVGCSHLDNLCPNSLPQIRAIPHRRYAVEGELPATQRSTILRISACSMSSSIPSASSCGSSHSLARPVVDPKRASSQHVQIEMRPRPMAKAFDSKVQIQSNCEETSKFPCGCWNTERMPGPRTRPGLESSVAS